MAIVLTASTTVAQDSPNAEAAEQEKPVSGQEQPAEEPTEASNQPETDPTADQKPATPLFDGTTLKGWRGYHDVPPKGWSVVNGEMCFDGKGDDLVTDQPFEHFELSLEFKTLPNTNSGILYRVRMGDNAPYMSGPEYQIYTPQQDKTDNLLHATGALYGLYPTQPNVEKPAGEWNTARIVVQGEHVEHWLNGSKVVDCDMNSDACKEKLAKSKFNGWPQFNKTKKGRIGLQAHGHPVWFRNVTIRELDAP